ncbi:hypothetical protein CSW62_03145 [Caulobacter sp. FWC2]|nr:hypothetical protein CSW62_03145 [Caulobacter sp. FWC2]
MHEKVERLVAVSFRRSVIALRQAHAPAQRPENQPRITLQGAGRASRATGQKKARRNRRASSLGRKRPGRAEAAAPPHGNVYRVRRKNRQVKK